MHPTTLRRWADQGDILVMTTPGGHRRFPFSEIERLKGSAGSSDSDSTDNLVSSALDHARQRLATHTTENWLIKIKDEEKSHLRTMGRDVLALLKLYLDSPTTTASLQNRVEEVGRSYGEYTHRSGLSLSDLLEATSFFRDSTLETVVEEMDTGEESFKQIFRSINNFFNTLLVSASAPYDHD